MSNPKPLPHKPANTDYVSYMCIHTHTQDYVSCMCIHTHTQDYVPQNTQTTDNDILTMTSCLIQQLLSFSWWLFFLTKKENILTPNAVEKYRTDAFRTRDQTLSFFSSLKKRRSLWKWELHRLKRVSSMTHPPSSILTSINMFTQNYTQ